jgi:excisionase family DNA binding protein
MCRLLTVPEVAELLHLSDWTVRRLAREGTLPVVRLTRGKMLFDADAVRAAVERAQAREDAPEASPRLQAV